MPPYCNREPPGRWVSRLFQLKHRPGNPQPDVQEPLIEQLLSASWSLFLAPHYQVKQWTIGMGISENTAFAPACSFRKNLILAMMLTLVFIAFLSIRLISLTLNPLGRLLEATRSLSSGSFMTRVALTSRDEFQELGDSFNDMTSRLGRHFRQQQTLTQISQALQQAESVERIMAVLSTHINGLVEATQMGAIFSTGKNWARRGIGCRSRN